MHHFLYFAHQLITKVMFILFSISSNLEFRSVKHTSIYENSKSKVFKNKIFLREIYNNWPSDLLGINVYKTLKPCWWSLFTILQLANTTSVVLKWGHFYHFYLYLSYFWWFQVISLFKELKIQDNILSLF